MSNKRICETFDVLSGGSELEETVKTAFNDNEFKVSSHLIIVEGVDLLSGRLEVEEDITIGLEVEQFGRVEVSKDLSSS